MLALGPSRGDGRVGGRLGARWTWGLGWAWERGFVHGLSLRGHGWDGPAVISTLSIRSPIILSFKRRVHICEIHEVLLLFSELIRA